MAVGNTVMSVAVRGSAMAVIAGFRYSLDGARNAPNTPPMAGLTGRRSAARDGAAARVAARQMPDQVNEF